MKTDEQYVEYLKQCAFEYRRRAKRHGITPEVISFTLEELISRWGSKCLDCGIDWEELDHLVPICLGGTHSIDNCQPVCKECNLKRWFKVMEDNPNIKELTKAKQKLGSMKSSLITFQAFHQLKVQEKMEAIAEQEAIVQQLKIAEGR